MHDSLHTCFDKYIAPSSSFRLVSHLSFFVQLGLDLSSPDFSVGRIRLYGLAMGILSSDFHCF